MARLRPDTDDILLAALRIGLYVPTEGRGDRYADVDVKRSDGWLARLNTRPLVTARTVTADATAMLRHRSYAEVDIQSWATDRRDASDLDDLALQALLAARGVEHAGGYISRIDVQSLGTEVPDPGQEGRGQLYRWQAGYRLTIRPA